MNEVWKWFNALISILPLISILSELVVNFSPRNSWLPDLSEQSKKMITDAGNTYIISLTVCFIAGSFLGVVLSENNNGYLGILVIIICDIIIFVWYYKNEPYIHRMYDSCQKMIYHCVISMIVFGAWISISFLIFNSILDENLDLILSQLLIAEVIIICVTLFHLFCFGKKHV